MEIKQITVINQPVTMSSFLRFPQLWPRDNHLLIDDYILMTKYLLMSLPKASNYYSIIDENQSGFMRQMFNPKTVFWTNVGTI